MNNFIDKFNSMVDIIQNHPHIDLLDFGIEPPPGKKLLNDIASKYQASPDKTVQDFYSQCNGVKLAWRLATNELPGSSADDVIEGSINILPIAEVFGGFGGKGWQNDLWSDGTPASKQAIKKQLRPFDYFYQEDSACTCFFEKDNTLEKQLYLHSIDYGVHRLGIDLDTYLELLLLTGGFHSWPFLLLDKGDYYNYDKLEAASKKYLPVIFPDFNYEDFKKMSHVKKQ